MDEHQKEFYDTLIENGVSKEVAKYIVEDKYVMMWYKEDTTTRTDVINYIELAKEIAVDVTQQVI